MIIFKLAKLARLSLKIRSILGKIQIAIWLGSFILSKGALSGSYRAIFRAFIMSFYNELRLEAV